MTMEKLKYHIGTVKYHIGIGKIPYWERLKYHI